LSYEQKRFQICEKIWFVSLKKIQGNELIEEILVANAIKESTYPCSKKKINLSTQHHTHNTQEKN
jgi:hypothetical protein